jgi:hypothetical protein
MIDDILELGRAALAAKQAAFGKTVWIEIARERLEGAPERVVVDRTRVQAFGGETHFARALARLRLATSPGVHIAIDLVSAGLPLAEVGLAFGADTWIAPLSEVVLSAYDRDEQTKLLQIQPLAERLVLRERELANLVRCAGYVPKIVQSIDGKSVERDPDDASPIARKFRAPGKDVSPKMGGQDDAVE